MKYLKYFIFIILIYFYDSAEACHPAFGNVYEAHEGNSLPYITAGQLGLTTSMLTTFATGTEDDRTQKGFQGLILFGTYFAACTGMTGHPDIQSKEWFEKNQDWITGASNSLSHPIKFIPKPESQEEIQKLKYEFYMKQKQYDKTATVLSFIANLGNGLTAREPANRAFGFSAALFSLIYYYWDPNGVRAYEPPPVTAYISPTKDSLSVGFQVKF